MKRFICLCVFVFQVFAKLLVNLPYGEFSIDDPLAESIIQSDAFSRLKDVHQYGISHYNQTFESYSRFDHCLGVYLLLNKENLSHDEQISGLLHDASHTAFSHFGDYFFKSHGEDAWQDLNHNEFLSKVKLDDILLSFGKTKEELYHKNKHFIALDQPLPSLCADRLEYNIQGAYRHGLITQDELKELFCDAKYEKGSWSFSNEKLAFKLAKASIFMMENIWSAPAGVVSNEILCAVVEHAVNKSYINLDDVCLKSDKEVMEILNSSNDEFIKTGIDLINKVPSLIMNGNSKHFTYKCRAIDPWIRKDNKLYRLTELSSEYHDAFNQAKNKSQNGMYYSIDETTLKTHSEYFRSI